MSGDDVEDEITLAEYREKLRREELVVAHLCEPSEEQLRTVECCARAARLRVNLQSITTRAQAERVIANLRLLCSRMRHI